MYILFILACLKVGRDEKRWVGLIKQHTLRKLFQAGLAKIPLGQNFSCIVYDLKIESLYSTTVLRQV